MATVPSPSAKGVTFLAHLEVAKVVANFEKFFDKKVEKVFENDDLLLAFFSAKK